MKLIRKLQKKLIKYAQKTVTKEYEKNGLTDNVLNAQIRVNKMRNKYNINELDETFVQ